MRIADIVAVDKPSGVMTTQIATQLTKRRAIGSLRIILHLLKLAKHSGYRMALRCERPGVVHRLDKETSGVLVFAKTQKVHEFLKEAFKAREVHKTYLAFVYGVPKERKGIIEFAIGRSRKDFRLRSAQPKAKGIMREALTRYEVIGDIGTHALLKAMPETGRTHQIRVHLKAIHHPIVGDSLYAPKRPYDLGFERLGLHAYQLDLPLPNGERKIITALPPADLTAAIAKFPNTEYLQARP